MPSPHQESFGESVADLAAAGRPESTDLDEICDRLGPELGKMAGRRLLLTGGAGFLGYYLVRTALRFNDRSPGPPIEVAVYDNFQRGLPEWLRELAQRPDLSLVRHDVTEPLPADLAEPQYIMHAASIASPTYYRKYPLETMDANVRGLRRLLDRCRDRGGIEGFLFFSSSEIYGDPSPDAIPTPETYRGIVSSIGPRACYDESKRYGETLCVTFHQQFGLPITIARPFNNYGPGLQLADRRLLPDFARCVLENRDLVMYSDGSPTRTFCYIADAVVGYYKVLVGGRAGEVYNIGADRPEISVAALADKVAELSHEMFGYPGRVVRQVHRDRDYLTDNPNRRCPDIGKARAELGFEPAISLDEGLRRSLLWYWKTRSGAVAAG